MNDEQRRLEEDRLGQQPWRKWGPYLSERQWGTVREDYSPDGEAWAYFPHEHARSRAYRWGEDGIAGVSDDQQRLCLALALWNGRDPILKERLFGLTNAQGNHGEDVKELYYYLDAVPTHSYLKMLYKYPQSAFPYAELTEENRCRDQTAPEFELLDTGVFNDDRYFDVFVEYAKASPDDLLMDGQLDPADQRFHYTLSSVYELPFGKGKHFANNAGKLLNGLIGGYELSGIYTFISGTPLSFPTNSSFFEGGNPAVSNPTATHEFNTSAFVPFPSRSVTVAQLQAYPSWTGVSALPGYNFVPAASDATRNGVYQDFATWTTTNDTTFGNIRNPPNNNFDLAIRKSFNFTEKVRLQLRMDAFDALNHPRFGNIDTTPTDAYFGYLNGSPKLSSSMLRDRFSWAPA